MAPPPPRDTPWPNLHVAFASPAQPQRTIAVAFAGTFRASWRAMTLVTWTRPDGRAVAPMLAILSAAVAACSGGVTTLAAGGNAGSGGHAGSKGSSASRTSPVTTGRAGSGGQGTTSAVGSGGSPGSVGTTGGRSTTLTRSSSVSGSQTSTSAIGPVCPGSSPPASGYPLCRTQTDCNVGAMCVAEPLPLCDVCLGTSHECTTDADCATANGFCQPTSIAGETCVCGPLTGTQCGPQCTSTSCPTDYQCLADGHCAPTPCTQGYSCATGTTCNASGPTADAHGCAPQLCTAGFQCAAGNQCSPTATGADPHGCAPILCTTNASCGVNFTCTPGAANGGCSPRKCALDSDCDCGACVEGSCAPHLYICQAEGG
jgi:hypothetical protein